MASDAEITTLVDTSVLLDVLTDDEIWGDWSARRLSEAVDAGRAVVNPIVYAELSVGFTRVEDLDEALGAAKIEREHLPYEGGFVAGKAFVAYRKRGGAKTSPLPDFYIGAHAAVSRFRLLTRDTSRYRTYFPTVDLIAPG